MKKKYVIITIISIVIILIAVSIKPVMKLSSDAFWDWVAYELDKEEAERIRKAENGEPVRGKDTVLIWENMYDISRHMGENSLSISTKEVQGEIIDKIIKYKYADDKLFVFSEEGYAVIDKDNLCRVFITVPEDEFVNGYSEDKEGNRKYFSRKIESKHIIYLTDYNSYTEEERKVFEKIKKHTQKE